MSATKSGADFSKVKPDFSQKENMAMQLRENEDEISVLKKKTLLWVFCLGVSLFALFHFRFDSVSVLNAFFVAFVVYMLFSKISEQHRRMSENRILRTFLGD